MVTFFYIVTVLRAVAVSKEDVRSAVTYPHGRLSSVGLLQSEDLCHHVIADLMQQDAARCQTHHHVTTHRRQTDRDGIWTCDKHT